MLAYLNIPKMFQHGPRAIFLQKSLFIAKIGRYGLLNCVTTVHVRNNSSSGLSSSNECIANIFVGNELSKLFDSRDRILSKYGHGLGAPIFEIKRARQISPV